MVKGLPRMLFKKCLKNGFLTRKAKEVPIRIKGRMPKNIPPRL